MEIAIFGDRFVSPLDLKPEDVVFTDISHALARLCRFGGRCSEFYSVAQHSVHVTRLVETVTSDPLVLKAALLHDAAEAYLGDIVTPLKRVLAVGGESVASHEARILRVIYETFSIPPLSAGSQALVKGADLTAMSTEARDLMGNPDWARLPYPDPAPVLPLSVEAAEREFVATWRRLH